MAVTEMKKLSLLLPKKDVNKMLKKLMWTGSVEVTDIEGEDLPTVVAEYAAELADYTRKRATIEEAMRQLKGYAQSGGGMFFKPHRYSPSVYEDAEAGLEIGLSVARDVFEANEQLASAQVKSVQTKAKIAALKPWRIYDLPLNVQGSERTSLLLGTLPIKVEPERVLEALNSVGDRYTVEWMDADENVRYLWMMVDSDLAEEMRMQLLPMGFNPQQFSEYGDITASEAISKLTVQYQEECQSISSAKQKLSDLGEQIEVLRLSFDLSSNLIERAEAKQKLVCTESIAMLSGWVPVNAQPIVEEELSKFVCAWQFEDPEEGEDAPILLQNGKISSAFEPVVAMYSLPAYKTFDPTQIMSIFYFIIFGLMFGDAVYGLLLILVGLVLPKYLNLSINTKKMFNMFGICGFSSLISGILFGSYCGNMLVSVFGLNVRPVFFDIVGIDALPGMINPLNKLVDNLSAAMVFLIFAVVIGVAHLFVGMGVKFYILCKEGKPFDAIVEVGSWYLIFVGIALALTLGTIPGVVVSGIGVLLIVFFHAKDTKNPVMRFLKGLLGLYDIVNYLSDLMSYSRIMALGLSSAIIAMVVNMLATMVGGSVIGMIFMPVVLIVGHILNIALNLLGTFVHTSRLQYIEFFGKFYVDGGRQFKPLAVHPAYTGVVMDEINKENI